jgi:hypothetical protein
VFSNCEISGFNGARLSQPQRLAKSTCQESFTPPGHAPVLRLGQPRSDGIVPYQNHFEDTPQFHKTGSNLFSDVTKHPILGIDTTTILD